MGMLPAGHQTHPVKVLLVEVGYVSDTQYEEKLKDKMAQHGKLLAALSNAGFEASITYLACRPWGSHMTGTCNSYALCPNRPLIAHWS